MPSTYYVAWWNRENLFDEENSPLGTEKLQRTIGADLVGWTPARRDRKISQLASVIGQMNGGAGPDMLGVCEVENRNVLDLLVAAVNTPLPSRNYDIVHADTAMLAASTLRSSMTTTCSMLPRPRCSSMS